MTVAKEKRNRASKAQRQKLFLIKRNKKNLRLRTKKKARQRRIRYRPPNPNKKNKQRRRKLVPRNPNQFKVVHAPSNFSFINNPEDILQYLNDASDHIISRNQVFFDISKVKSITPDAIALLIASISDPSFNRGFSFRGNTPDDKDQMKIFTDSGFYSYVNTNFKKPTAVNLLLHKVSNNKVEPVIAKEASQRAIRHTFKTDIIFEPIYEMLIECMSNTNNHAGLEKPGKYDWWLGVYTNPDTEVSSFSFIDLGVGIFDSLPVREFRRVMTKLNISSNTDLVEKLLQGEIKSRTKKPERGKGIPQIYEHSKNEDIKRFTIISNDVYADVDNQDYRKLKNSFNGTFLYWELHPKLNVNGN